MLVVIPATLAVFLFVMRQFLTGLDSRIAGIANTQKETIAKLDKTIETVSETNERVARIEGGQAEAARIARLGRPGR
jgi:hypothetical protein